MWLCPLSYINKKGKVVVCATSVVGDFEIYRPKIDGTKICTNKFGVLSVYRNGILTRVSKGGARN